MYFYRTLIQGIVRTYIHIRMTTPYSVTTSMGTTGFSGHVRTSILGPLTNRQYPSAMPYHSYGTLMGVRPTPPQFYPSQTPISSDMGINARRQYWAVTGVSAAQKAQQEAIAKTSPVTQYVSPSTQRRYPVSTHVNYIEPMPASMRTTLLKSVAVGKSVYKVGLPTDAPISTKCYYPSGTRSTIRRVRSGGCAAPKKKGSIYNTSLTQSGICSWGSFPRQNY